MSLRSVSPTTGEVLETFEETPASELERILAGAQAAFLAWRHRPLGERGVLGVVLRRPGTLLDLRRALGDRLPHLERHRPRIVALLRPQKPRGLAQEGAALGERAAAPVEERDLCPGEDPLQLARRRLLEAFEHFARGRADGPEAHRPSPPAGERTLLCGPLHPTGSVARARSVIAPPA